MDLRKTLGERPSPVMLAIASVVLLLVAGIVGFSAFPRPAQVPIPDRLYFSDDDGATWFLDGAGNIPPYADASGKQAYRAILYRAHNGKVFCGLLEGYDDQDKAEIEKRIQSGESAAFIAASAHLLPWRQWLKIKHSGEKRWLKAGRDPASRERFQNALRVKCPGSDLPALPLWPGEKAESAH